MRRARRPPPHTASISRAVRHRGRRALPLHRQGRRRARPGQGLRYAACPPRAPPPAHPRTCPPAAVVSTARTRRAGTVTGRAPRSRVEAPGRAEGHHHLGHQAQQLLRGGRRVGHTGQLRGLVLVGQQQVDGGEQLVREALRGRGREDRTPTPWRRAASAPAATASSGSSSWSSRAPGRRDALLVRGRQVPHRGVGAGDDDDRVAPLVVDDDMRGARRAVLGAQQRGVHAGRLQAGPQPGAEVVRADRADHRDRPRRARAAATAWLAPLPPGTVRNSRPRDGLTEPGSPAGIGDEIHVGAAEHGDAGGGRRGGGGRARER